MVLEVGWNGKCIIVKRDKANDLEKLGNGEWDDATRFISGCLLIDTMKYATIQDRVDSTAVTVISIICSPSMKTDDYNVIIVFDAHGNFCPAPKSRCQCPDGNLFCSHMIACLVLLSMMQSKLTMSMIDFIRVMPPSVKDVHAACIPWVYLWGVDNKLSNDSLAAFISINKVPQLDGEDETTIQQVYDDTKGDDILAKAHTYFNACSVVSMKNDKPGECPIKVAGIEKFMEDLIESRSDVLPYSTQRRKDLVHERLHVKYEEGRDCLNVHCRSICL